MTETKQCIYCEKEKDISEFEVFIKRNSIYEDDYGRKYCKDCTNKRKCHTCKQVRDEDRFYQSRGRIDCFKCKDCHKADYKRIIQTTPLF